MRKIQIMRQFTKRDIPILKTRIVSTLSYKHSLYKMLSYGMDKGIITPEVYNEIVSFWEKNPWQNIGFEPLPMCLQPLIDIIKHKIAEENTEFLRSLENYPKPASRYLEDDYLDHTSKDLYY